MPVVSNTSPLLNLRLVEQQFGVVLIPPAVLDELCVDDERPGSAPLKEALSGGWLQVVPVSDRALVEALGLTLDRGEAEAIALAIQEKAECVLLDERDARRVIRAFGLHVTGVVGTLLKAHRDGLLPDLPQAIDELQARAGFRLAPSLVARVLASR